MRLKTLRRSGLKLMKEYPTTIILSCSLILLYLLSMARITLLQLLSLLMKMKTGMFVWLTGKELPRQKQLGGFSRYMMNLDLWALELKMSLTRKLYFISCQKKCDEEIPTCLLKVLEGLKFQWTAVNDRLTQSRSASDR